MSGNIVSSVIVSSQVEADGRFSVHEVHTDVAGVAHAVFYLADASADQSAARAAHAATLAASLKAGEIASNIAAVSSLGAQAVVTFNYSSGVENGTALLPFAQSSTGLTALLIAEYLNTFSLTDLAADSGLTPAQAGGLQVALIQPNAALMAQIRAAQG